MLMLTLTSLVLFIEVVALLTHRYGGGSAILVVALLSLAVYPQLLSARPAVANIGIAGPAPEIRTFTLAIAGGVVVMAIWKGYALLPLAFIPFAAWLTLGMTTLWEGNAEQWAGAIQLFLGVLAWSLGASVKRSSGLKDSRVVAMICAAIVCGQGLVCTLQFVGLPINRLSEADAGILGDRTNGTLNHPDNLGKALVLLMTLVVPCTKSPDRPTRLFANIALFASFLPLALAQGRANLLSAFVVVCLWVLIQPKESPVVGGSIILLGGIAALAASSVVLVARFEQDPSGGVRNQITAIALRYLPRVIEFGTGPNSYVSYMSPLSGSYIPVHNTYLLLTAELGLVGAISFLLPLAISITQALKLRKDTTSKGNSARAILVFVPPMLLIGLTGWGLLGTSVLGLWFLVAGYHAAGLRDTDPVAAKAKTVPGQQLIRQMLVR